MRMDMSNTIMKRRNHCLKLKKCILNCTRTLSMLGDQESAQVDSLQWGGARIGEQAPLLEKVGISTRTSPIRTQLWMRQEVSYPSCGMPLLAGAMFCIYYGMSWAKIEIEGVRQSGANLEVEVMGTELIWKINVALRFSSRGFARACHYH